MKLLLILTLLLSLSLPASAEEALVPMEDTDLCAAAYLGYGEDIGSFLRSEDAAELLVRYPFLARIPAMNTVTLPGCEIYCIVPAKGVTLVVEALDTAHEAYPQVFQEVLRTTEPVLLIGNESDIMPNMQVRLLAEGQERLFTPYMSLRDGSFCAHAPGDGVYDFTLYPEDFVFEE